MVSAPLFRRILAESVGTGLLFLFSTSVHAQSKFIDVTPTDYDRYAASQAQNVTHHARPANTPAGRAARRTELSTHTAGQAPAAAAAPDSGAPRYPADLEYHGGNVATTMRSHLIYVNLGTTTCNSVATCWGNPQRFLHDLGNSNMIHIVDQYTNSTLHGRYTVSEEGVRAHYPQSAHPYTDADILTIVHSVVSKQEEPATGYTNEYHVFLVPGQDECFDATYTTCFSPDIPPSFFFCAYHGSADFQDIGHVLYSVEPAVDVPGCSARPNGAQGQLADSTNNTLSHETFETITDPDGTAWWNSLDNGLYGQEIGDECSFLEFTSTAVYFDPSDVSLNGSNYSIQPEADNNQHACTTSPP